ncbi:MAG: pantetheine-phosphate adenylyltransferase [Kiritimatiellae bacterium]|nr:pantetheine-phosphate adenylyltransferase [Kiritimatiellia bacterium]MBR4946223.1 pantetheine-phosphate adenylyltransferase [Kiritimatiellia bacterium]MBR5587914.1 pantetheine-phosphate adenylyltransferase [Kiritimatiellia bacterium]
MKETTAVYPGTFDPMTQGHFDLIRRSAALFDQLIVAVAGISPKPTRLFGIEERIAMVQECLAEGGITNVIVKPLDCLLVEFCRRNNVRSVVRGLRAYSDFEYEFQMALTNRQLAPEVETLFLMPNEEHSYITASTVREVARYGGDTSHFVPACVQKHLQDYLRAHPEQCIQGASVGNTGAFDR